MEFIISEITWRIDFLSGRAMAIAIRLPLPRYVAEGSIRASFLGRIFARGHKKEPRMAIAIAA